MRNKLLLIVLFIASMTPCVAQLREDVPNGKILSAEDKNICEVLDKIYDDLCNYKENPTILKPILGAHNTLGGYIQDRMLILFAILVLLSSAYKIILVLGDPEESFSKYMFLKPLALFLFLTFYPYCMNTVNTIAEFFTVKTLSEKTVLVTYKNIGFSRDQQLAYNVSSSISLSSGGISHGKTPASSHKEQKYTTTDVLRNHDLMQRLITLQKIELAKEQGRSLSKDELQEMEEALYDIEKESFWVKGFKELTYYAGEIIGIILRILQTVILSVLFIGGPIAICMELILPGSLKKWFGIFIYSHLWTPVIMVVEFVALTLNATLIGLAEWLTFAIQLVIIAVFILVPKFANYFLQTQEGGAMLGATTYKTFQHLQLGMKSLSGGFGKLAGGFRGTTKK